MSGASQPFRFAESDELEGLALARLVSRLGVDCNAPVTFVSDGRGDPASAWEIWLKTWFAPVLAPAFVVIHRLAGEFRPEEIAARDLELDRALGNSQRTRSLAGAAGFLDGKSEMRAHREWSRFAERVADGRTPGHALTLFALQASLFHLPLAPALGAYAWFELESGLPRNGFRDRAGTGTEALALFARALPHVRVALAGERGDFGEGTLPLRAI